MWACLWGRNVAYLSHWPWVDDQFLSSEIIWFYRLHTRIHAQKFISYFISEAKSCRSVHCTAWTQNPACGSCTPPGISTPPLPQASTSRLPLPAALSMFTTLSRFSPQQTLSTVPGLHLKPRIFLSHFLPGLSPQLTVKEVTNGDKGNLELKSTGKEIENKAQTGISYYGG